MRRGDPKSLSRLGHPILGGSNPSWSVFHAVLSFKLIIGIIGLHHHLQELSRHVTKQVLIRGLVVAHRSVVIGHMINIALINFNIIKPIIIVQRSQPQNFHFFLAFLWH